MLISVALRRKLQRKKGHTLASLGSLVRRRRPAPCAPAPDGRACAGAGRRAA